MTGDDEVKFTLDMLEGLFDYESALQEASVIRNSLIENQKVMDAVWSTRHDEEMSSVQMVALAHCRKETRQLLSEIADIKAEFEIFWDTDDYVFDVLAQPETFSPGKLRIIHKNLKDEIERFEDFNRRSDALDVKVQDLLLALNASGDLPYPKLI